MSKEIFCKHLKKEGPALEKAPLPGEIGQKILENICAEAWAEWIEMQMKIVNEYRLDLSSAEHRQVLKDQMDAFFGFASGDGKQLDVGTPTY